MKKRKGSVGFVLQKKDAAVKEETHFIKRILNTLLIVFAAVVLGFGVTQFVMQSVYMTGPSMQETLKDGDEIILLPSIAGGSGRKKTEVSESDTEVQKSLKREET